MKKINSLILAFWLNLIFSIIEFIGGFFTNSTTIMTDAIHDFTDAMAIGLATWMEKISNKKSSKHFSIGYKRFSMLSGLIMSLVLVGGSVFMIYHAIQSFFDTTVVHSIGMLALAVLGIAVNGFAVWKIHNENKGNKNYNSNTIMLHLLEDVLGWVAVLFGAILIYFTHWFWIDRALTIAIAGFIIFNALKNIIAIMKVFLQSVPENVNFEKIRSQIITLPGVEGIHEFYIWSMDGSDSICSLHVEVHDDIEEADIFITIKEILKKNCIHQSTIQIEKGDLRKIS